MTPKEIEERIALLEAEGQKLVAVFNAKQAEWNQYVRNVQARVDGIAGGILELRRLLPEPEPAAPEVPTEQPA